MEQIDYNGLQNAIPDILSDFRRLQEELTRLTITGSANAEMQVGLCLSGIEIKLTNFTQEIRRKLA
jgi:hypothetical protein